MNRLGSLLLLTVAMLGCASGGTARSVPLGQPFTLQPGERVALPGDASLRYLNIANDSRCPPDVQCIRAGDADVLFEFVSTAGGAAEQVTLNTEKAPSASIGAWRLQLVTLEHGDAPRATVRVDQAR